VCDISPSTVGFVVRLIAHEVGVWRWMNEKKNSNIGYHYKVDP